MSMDGVEIFDSGALVVLAVYAAVIVLTYVAESKGWTTPQNRKEIIRALIHSVLFG